ncbi:hypothetical protein PISMIDRAFT_17259 [Pisolithus microcarpus 441]|uniref:Uncharacterized protein n=1 Tax=Pisolithus microcarpus 441 TaxID=765257 RepID=A0A0C9YCS9_9AGAM|nr:hypothetical protein PISMIDRAFT_17259 [Pisolithus microcarpus 441]
MTEVPDMGTQQDILQQRRLTRLDNSTRQKKVADARHLMYEANYAINTLQVEALLRDESLVPTSNAFSD